jgi:hypothetical protein
MERYSKRKHDKHLKQPEPRRQWMLFGFLVLLLWCTAVGVGVFLVGLVWTSSHPVGLI